MSEERFAYRGIGSIPRKHLSNTSAQRILMVMADAVLPRITENPKLTRTELEIARRRGGWEQQGGLYALRGWERCVTELATGFDSGIVLGAQFDSDRSNLLERSIRLALNPTTPGGVGTAYIDGDSSDWLSDLVVFAVQRGIAMAEGTGHKVAEVHLLLAGDADFESDVADRLAIRIPQVTFHLMRSHPILGLLSGLLPMPNDGLFLTLDSELERDWQSFRLLSVEEHLAANEPIPHAAAQEGDVSNAASDTAKANPSAEHIPPVPQTRREQLEALWNEEELF